MTVECAFSLSNAIVSLAGVALGAAVGFFSARHISDRNARATACAKLRAAFAPALAIIYIAGRHGTHDRPPVDATIKDSLFSHASAIEEFRPFVPVSERITYQEAWEGYRQIAAQCQYATAADERCDNLQSGELFEQKIHVILSFTKT